MIRHDCGLNEPNLCYVNSLQFSRAKELRGLGFSHCAGLTNLFLGKNLEKKSIGSLHYTDIRETNGPLPLRFAYVFQLGPLIHHGIPKEYKKETKEKYTSNVGRIQQAVSVFREKPPWLFCSQEVHPFVDADCPRTNLPCACWRLWNECLVVGDSSPSYYWILLAAADSRCWYESLAECA